MIFVRSKYKHKDTHSKNKHKKIATYLISYDCASLIIYICTKCLKRFKIKHRKFAAQMSTRVQHVKN